MKNKCYGKNVLCLLQCFCILTNAILSRKILLKQDNSYQMPLHSYKVFLILFLDTNTPTGGLNIKCENNNIITVRQKTRQNCTADQNSILSRNYRNNDKPNKCWTSWRHTLYWEQKKSKKEKQACFC